MQLAELPLRVLKAPKQVITLNFAALAAMPGIVTVPLGTVAISGGKAKAATLADALNNLVTNGEFTTNTSGWTPEGVTLTRVDSEADPGVNSGGTDKWAGKIIKLDTGSNKYILKGANDALEGASYQYRARTYSPSANTQVMAAQLYAATGWTPDFSQAASIEDVWELLQSANMVADAGARTIVCFVRGTTIGDTVYLDAAVLYRQNAIFLVQAAPQFDAAWYHTMPASGVCPRSGLFRYTDALNYWEARMTPGAPGTVKIVEVVAGAETTRATANVTLSASTEYRLGVRCRGADVKTYVNGVAAASYATMTTGLTARGVGVLFYDTEASCRAMEVVY